MRYQFTIERPRPRFEWLGLIPLLAVLVAMVLAIACGDKKKQTQTDASLGTVGPTATPTVPATPVVVGPITFERAESLYHDRRFAEATGVFRAYTETKPENPWGFYMLGLSSWKAGDRTAAVTALQQAIALDSTHVKARLNLSRVLLEDGRPSDAVPHIQRAIALDSTSSEGYRLLGRAYDALGQPDSAVTAFEHALVCDDGDVWAMNNLAMVYIRAGKFADALPPLARATQLAPEVATFQSNFGLALERTGHYPQARDAYKAAIAADSTVNKATASLERVGRLPEDSLIPPVDLPTLVGKFIQLIEEWKKTPGHGC
jgi:predicted Zn-dependent protease